MSQFLDNTGLAHYDEKIKEWAQGQFSNSDNSAILERIAACEAKNTELESTIATLQAQMATIRIFS